MLDEGYIKYQIDWQLAPAPATHTVEQLNECRSYLYKMGLIGMYSNGIGFGNISQRLNNNHNNSNNDDGLFVISGTQTGHLPQLSPQHYAIVTQYNIAQNWLQCKGAIKASSESLTHAALYQLNPQIDSIIHVHDLITWEKQLYHLPTTAATVPYGTPEMAAEIALLYQQTLLPNIKVLVMAGHKEGIISFGKNCHEATEALMSYLVR